MLKGVEVIEDIPENYEKLLKDRAYLEFALKKYEEREKELIELITTESNEYKRNALKSKLGDVEYAKELLTNLIQSLQSEPGSYEEANRRNPRLASSEGSRPLKQVLVEGAWDRVRSGLVPLSTGGTVPIWDF